MNKRIAVVNRTGFKNYGSVLQVFALSEAIRSLGYDSTVVWQRASSRSHRDFRLAKTVKTMMKLAFHPSLWKKTLSILSASDVGQVSAKTVRLFDEFVEKNIPREFYTPKELKRLAAGEKYSKFVCGSDQIWCSTTLYVDPLFYLRFAPREKRVSYAPSIGRDYIPRYNRRTMRKYICGIDALSVRETQGAALIKELTGKDAEVVLDPTLLLTRDDWKKHSVPATDTGYILCYFLYSCDVNTQREIAEYAKKTGRRVIALRARLEETEKLVEVEYPDAGPSEFLGLVDGADTVITDSYHGMLFSIIHRKNFWSVERAVTDYDQSTRQRSILEILGLEDRYVTHDFSFDDSLIDYTAVIGILENYRQRSLSYLRAALEGKNGN